MLPSKVIKFGIKHSPHCMIGGSAAFQLQDTNRVHHTGDQGAAATAFYRDFNGVKQRRCQFSWVVRRRRPLRRLDKAALCHCCASETKHTGRASPPPCSGLSSRGWPMRIGSPRGSPQPSEPVWLRTLPAQLGGPTQVKNSAPELWLLSCQDPDFDTRLSAWKFTHSVHVKSFSAVY